MLILFGFPACGGGSSDSEEAKELENRLSGNTYNAVGIEEITAFFDDCEDGALDEEDPEVENFDITISFGPTVYTMNVDGEIALGGWEAVDGNTILVNTNEGEGLELDIDVVKTTIFFDLSEDWLTENCSNLE
ncbi:MAG: hypothetical protein HY541_04960 [Deltaproteobacteria bacterium]|nr:hypothetical protein [Deltaproteobacteria bacterium]